MDVSVMGTGYVGLVTAACLAEHGNRVVCVDVDAGKVEEINAGRAPFYEPGLSELVDRHASKSLEATLDLTSAVESTDLTLIAVPTPFDGEAIDLTYVRQAAAQLGEAIVRKGAYHVAVVKSTVVPGTTDGVVGGVIEAQTGMERGVDFGLGMNPEFLSEGTAVSDLMHPDRIVAGGIDDRTRDRIVELYATFDAPLFRTTNTAAEMIKYGSNALQACMISFANEIANLCEAVGDVDAMDVMAGVHAMRELHGDDGSTAPIVNFLSPGCGFGGSCFPKDLRALAAHGKRLGNATPVLDAILAVNADRVDRLVDLLSEQLGGLAGRRIAVLGLAFKPGTDDIRESPAFPLVRALVDGHADVVAHDPVALEPAARALQGTPIRLTDDLTGALAGTDAVVIVTRWPEYAAVPSMLASGSSAPLVIDGRRMLDPSSVSRYRGVGLRTTR